MAGGLSINLGGTPSNKLPTGTTSSQIQKDVASGGLQMDYVPSSYVGGGITGGTAAPAVDRAALASYDQAIANTQAGIGQADNSLNSGYSTIDASYNNALNQLLASRNTGEADYNTNKLKTGNDYVAGKNTIGAQAGGTLNSLRRLLGQKGAGGGSAATILAPGEVAKQATMQRSGLSKDFGENNQALDTQWNRFLTDYENQRSSAATQRLNSRGELESKINSSKAGILQALASLQAQRAQAAGGNAVGAAQPYLDQANSLLNQATSYKTAPINYQTQAYTAPELAKYTVNPNATPTYNGQSQGNDYTSPYLAALLGKREQRTVGA